MTAADNNDYQPIIIMGSSRGDGNTLKAVRMIFEEKDAPLVDLSHLDISYYDYAGKNLHDDFLPLIERMLNHNPIVLATPVYWYTMSAVMKTFIDRWSDILTFRKDLGRKLKGKEVYIITTYGSSFPRGFEDAFSQTCDYMGMHYRSCFYYHGNPDKVQTAENAERAKVFIDKLKR